MIKTAGDWCAGYAALSFLIKRSGVGVMRWFFADADR